MLIRGLVNDFIRTSKARLCFNLTRFLDFNQTQYFICLVEMEFQINRTIMVIVLIVLKLDKRVRYT